LVLNIECTADPVNGMYPNRVHGILKTCYFTSRAGHSAFYGNYLHNNSMHTVDYHQLTQALERLQIAADAAECQGAMSAVICLTGQDGLASWLPAHFPEIESGVAEGNALAMEAKQLILDLYQYNLGCLGQGNLDYALLMPDDDDSLHERTDALGHWCQGFMLGMRFCGAEDPGQFTGELAEILDDIREISQVSSEALDDTEEEEQSYTELVEYLRVGVMLFCETLHASQGTAGSTLVH